ncbi:hypothetical protein SP15_176 [Bacillus phage SP-15]|uniref:Uncharacterized protein n=1 Tax=Bacillus phage SP-15 TaxID=1792032 RepID=A0A127AXP1_9CAUD|nr:hypothetical protein SP15_176 [Bacillus phage SP-15]AMM44974.1 hypothetical protein SP15_176 [Bacillus phage SP-15]
MANQTQVKLSIYGEKVPTVDFEGQGFNDNHLELLIKGTFSALGVPAEVLQSTSTKTSVEVGNDSKTAKQLIREQAPFNTGKEYDVPVDIPAAPPTISESKSVSRPRTLPLIGNGGTIGLEERLSSDKVEALKKVALTQAPVTSDTSEEPDYYKTGIKHKDDTPLYKIHYKCPEGHKGRYYIPLGTSEVECRECGVSLTVEPANPEKGFGTTEAHRDDWGNFFVAYTPSENQA